MKMKQLLPFCVMAVMGIQGHGADSGHYLGVDLGGGLHTFLYSPKGGEKSAGAGGLFQLQYQYMFNERWGIGGGAGLSTLHSSSRYTYNRYRFREAQDALDIDVTLQGFYRYPLSNRWKAQVGVGASLNFPVSMGYKIKSGVEKYSPRDGRISRRSANVGALLDLGVLYPMNENIDWYFGLYGNYQFVSTTKKYDGVMINSHNRYVNALNSGEISHGVMVHPLEVGVKVGLRFSLTREQERCIEIDPTEYAIPIEVPERVSTSTPEENVAIIMQSAHFGFSSIIPTFEGENVGKAFDDLKKYLEKNPEKNIYLVGHSDNVGEAEINMEISEKRAEAYKGVLVYRGFPADRIITIGKGKSQPIADNSTEEGRSKNRRVEMFVR